jgi:hypothetical protein
MSRKMTGPSDERPKKSMLHLILDFDGTITTADTTHLLGRLAAENPYYDMFHNRRTRVWDRVVQDYMADLRGHEAQYSKEANDGDESHTGKKNGVDSGLTIKTIKEEIAYQQSLAEVEQRSLDRVLASKLMQGICDSLPWESGALMMCKEKEVIVRPGFWDLVAAVRLSGAYWGVVSVNWSSAWIRGVLKSSYGIKGQGEDVSFPGDVAQGVIEELPVLSNDIQDSDGSIRGPMVRI